MPRIWFTSILALGTIALNAQTRSADNVALCKARDAIQLYCRNLDDRLKALPQRTLGRPFSDQGGWRDVRDDYEGIIARVFIQSGNPIVVAFSLSSESGDWALEAVYYYRIDGTLAKKHEVLNTFYGDASVTRDTLYACSGAVLSKVTEHRDLKTKKVKHPDLEFIDEQSPEYKRVRDLPFLRLLRTQPR